jgi:predicted enzyme related to lactoylglutathione lyase
VPRFPVPETEPIAIGAPVGFIVSTDADRFDAMATFYADILALPVRSRHVGFVNFVWNDFRLTIHVHSDVHGSAVDPNRMMINFSVSDIAATYRRLVDEGVAFTRHPEQESWGGWIATFADPDGNTLQLLQLAE